MEKLLGKIESIKFGYVGYQDMQFGLQITFSAKGFGVCDTIAEAWVTDMSISKHSQWSEEDRDSAYARTARRINEIMRKAKVTDINKLVNIPVELTIEGNTLKEWRVLEEVL